MFERELGFHNYRIAVIEWGSNKVVIEVFCLGLVIIAFEQALNRWSGLSVNLVKQYKAALFEGCVITLAIESFWNLKFDALKFWFEQPVIVIPIEVFWLTYLIFETVLFELHIIKVANELLYHLLWTKFLNLF